MSLEQPEYLKLNEDEVEHFRNTPENVMEHLIMVENAAVISLNGLTALENPPTTNSA